jgi:uncharacterized OsmC-like protein
MAIIKKSQLGWERKMAESVVVIQKSNFETRYLAPDMEDLEKGELKPVSRLLELTPYGQLLAGLGGCVAMVIHTFASHHGHKLLEVELKLDYDRVFNEDCENCENIDKYEERIREVIIFRGKLDEREKERLFQVSKHCPIHKMMERGIQIESRQEEE